MATIPTESIECLALVRPGSRIDREIGSSAPAFVIYEYDRGLGTREVRMGEGSWLFIVDSDHDDLILLREFTGTRLQAFCDTWCVEHPDPALLAVARGEF